MSDRQMDLYGGKARPKPLCIPASVKDNARAMLEPEEQKNTAVVNQPARGGGARTLPYAEQSRIDVHAPTKCPMCGQDKELQWVNPGNLGPNTEICRNCIPKLFARYGYQEPGFRIIDNETVELFSETTDWKRIKTY